MNEIIKFKSGLRLAVQPMKSTRGVSIGVFVGVGSAYENRANNGISHFIEHMLFKGTKNRSAYRISEESESIGAQLNAYTARDRTCFYSLGTSEHTEQCAELLSDLYFNSLFDDDGMNREKGVILEEINMCEDDPSDVCNDLALTAIFGKKGLGQTILGTAKNVKAFTRDDCLSYMDKFYSAKNTVIAIAGDVTKDEAIGIVDKYFECEFEKKANAKVQKLKREDFKTVSLKKAKKCEQANVIFAFPSYNRGDERTDIAALVSFALGGGMSSRLFQKLREELGVVYSVDTTVNSYVNNGVFEIYLATAPDTLDKAIKGVAEVIKKFTAEGMTDKEISTAKEQYKTSAVLVHERCASVVGIIGRKALLENKTVDVDETIERTNGYTKDQINAVLRDTLDVERVAASYAGKKYDCDVLSLLKKYIAEE